MARPRARVLTCPLPYPDLRRRVALLTPRERLWWLSCFPLGLVMAALETLGGLVIFALTAALLDTGSAGGVVGGALVSTLQRAGVSTSPITLTVLAAGVYLVKNVVLLGAVYYRARVAGSIGASLSARTAERYLTAPYVFHLARHSADTAQNVLGGVPAIIRLLEAIVTLTTEVLVVIGLALLLMRVALVETIVAAALIGAMVGLFVLATRSRFQSLGARHFQLSASVLKAMQQALGGFKEVVVFGRERHFAEAIARDERTRMRVVANHAGLESVPRLVTEAAFMLGLVALVVALEIRTGSLGGVIPFIGLYAYAGFRLIPAGHRIAFQAGAIRYEVAASDALCRELDELAALPPPAAAGEGAPMAFRDRLTLSGVTYTYERGDRRVLDGIDLEVTCGECVALVGATGAGKTTLVDLIMGLLTPTAGRITVDGVPIGANLPGWRRQIGYVPQAPFLLDDTLRHNIAFGVPARSIDDAAVRAAMRVSQLQGVVDALPAGLDTVIGERGVRLSGGERQRLSIARALYGDPVLLVLDEATSSLDPGTERALTQAIEQLKGRKTLLVIAHRLSTVERADRVVVLQGGRVEAIGRYDELVQTNQAFRALAALAES